MARVLRRLRLLHRLVCLNGLVLVAYLVSRPMLLWLARPARRVLRRWRRLLLRFLDLRVTLAKGLTICARLLAGRRLRG